ncbi:hypothetical protein PR202_ga18700 [Eleusine coracana subsp. coracana]|uniref:Uncharacterized protein n=1 Tax=Eleusine coracana subsp. coracana TaxID=191504 RepID=A0AAV5CTW7_ELECO|nr:hypothetical protein PR202_ga18700 [Eleusine coracana subsp. coracana]
MQFTESARAKASANASPKMSPDIQDNHPRKRHSLPMTNGKQDSSPRMQRSSSQAQQNVKSNGTVPHSSSGECFILLHRSRTRDGTFEDCAEQQNVGDMPSNT